MSKGYKTDCGSDPIAVGQVLDTAVSNASNAVGGVWVSTVGEEAIAFSKAKSVSDDNAS